MHPKSRAFNTAKRPLQNKVPLELRSRSLNARLRSSSSQGWWLKESFAEIPEHFLNWTQAKSNMALDILKCSGPVLVQAVSWRTNTLE